MSRLEGIRLLLAGGLGNQLFQYAACRALSLARNCPLEIDLRFYDKVETNAADFFRPFLIRDLNIQADIIEYTGSPHAWHSRALRMVSGERRANRYRSDFVGFDSEFLELEVPVVVSSYLQSGRYFEDTSELIRRELDPRIWIDEPARTVLEEWEGRHTVAVHVRRTDYVKHDALNIGDLSRYYARALNMAAQHDERVLVCVFSDDVAWCRSSGLFDGYDTRYIEFEDSIMNPGRELAIMSRCDSNVIANSTFSWWGAWLGRPENRRVFAPSTWMNGIGTRERAIVPNSWTVVDL